jgi:3-dehydroquinate synthase
VRKKEIPIKTVWVWATSRRYPVWLAEGLLRRAGEFVVRVQPGCRRLFVVSSPGVWALWGKELARGLRPAGIRAIPLLLDDRERAKRLSAVEPLADELLRQGADRSALLAALGGGVVGDITGFVAATYMRGVDYIQIPTTVVGQVDSAIGGKTGVNLGSGKNLVGAFHQPRAVLSDPRTLFTLPEREYRSGVYEIIKCAVIGDTALFRFLERNLDKVLAGETKSVLRAIASAVRLKAEIVSADERECGKRRALNLGHTFGHAWETLSDYKSLRHGEAVGWGMLAATLLAERLGQISGKDAERISTLIASVGPLPRLPQASAAQVYKQMLSDKKSRKGELQLVLPRGIGRVSIDQTVPRHEVMETLRNFPGKRR